MFEKLMTYSNALRFLCAGILCMLIYIGYLAFFPFKTIVINNSPVPVLTNPIKRGDVLTYEVDYCRYTDVPSHFTRTLQGPILITLAEGSGKGQLGCHKIKVSNTPIPSYAIPGTYHLEIDACVQITALQNKCIKYQTQDFRVE